MGNIDQLTKEDLLVNNLICKIRLNFFIEPNGTETKELYVETSIDDIKKLESIFTVHSNFKEVYRTKFLEKAIEEYNKIDLVSKAVK